MARRGIAAHRGQCGGRSSHAACRSTLWRLLSWGPQGRLAPYQTDAEIASPPHNTPGLSDRSWGDVCSMWILLPTWAKAEEQHAATKRSVAISHRAQAPFCPDAAGAPSSHTGAPTSSSEGSLREAEVLNALSSVGGCTPALLPDVVCECVAAAWRVQPYIWWLFTGQPCEATGSDPSGRACMQWARCSSYGRVTEDVQCRSAGDGVGAPSNWRRRSISKVQSKCTRPARPKQRKRTRRITWG